MTRKLLAIFALLSGLAVLTGPANASLSPSSSACDASVEASADNGAATEQAGLESAPEDMAARKRIGDRQPHSPTPPALSLPVLMGVDRALE